MKIGINALFLQNPTNGSGQYLLHLLHALAEVDRQNEYVLLGAKPVGAGLAPALVSSKFSSPLEEREGGQGGRGQGQALPLQVSFPYRVRSVPACAQRYGVGKQYIFYLGGLDLRKNVLQLVRAFAHLCTQLHNPNVQLLISGDPAKQAGPFFPDPRPVAEELGVADRVIYRFVEDEDKSAMYSGASLFGFPSPHAGLGLA